MRRPVVSTFASLDGVIDAPAESTYLRFHHREVEGYSYELLSTAGALLLGRKTFQGLAAAWRPRTGRISDRITTIRSSSSRPPSRAPTLITGGDIPGQVASLKAQSGGDILSYGCGRLARF
jgi:dihydrofolate reductase